LTVFAFYLSFQSSCHLDFLPINKPYVTQPVDAVDMSPEALKEFKAYLDYTINALS
jgi:hypothetical protein